MSHPHGVPAAELADDDLLRELTHLHATRTETFLHGSDVALAVHTRRTQELEADWVRRNPARQIDPDRLRTGARER